MADRLPPVDLTHTARPKLPLQAALVAPDIALAIGELPATTAALDHPGLYPQQRRPCSSTRSTRPRNSAIRSPSLDTPCFILGYLYRFSWPHSPAIAHLPAKWRARAKEFLCSRIFLYIYLYKKQYSYSFIASLIDATAFPSTQQRPAHKRNRHERSAWSLPRNTLRGG